MKAMEWQRYLREQSDHHGKTLFTITELANVAKTSANALNVELSRLVQRGIVVRYATGCYGLPNRVTPEHLVVALDPAAYITGAHALYRHNLITQPPKEIMCFTNRRHAQSRVRETPLGRIRFACVKRKLYMRPPDLMAGKEQALCDYIYMARHDGIEPLSLFTFRNLSTLDTDVLDGLTSRYPTTLRDSLRQMMAGTASYVGDIVSPVASAESEAESS